MALALRFAEEGEFSSRAVDASYDDDNATNAVAPTSFFRWSKAARERLGSSDAALRADRLIVATRGAPQRFLEHLTAAWPVVATLVASDEAPTSTTLAARRGTAAALVVSLDAADHADFGQHVAVVVPNDISNDAVWSWTQTVTRHIDARETIVLDSQVSPIYDFGFGADEAPMLRTLATASARDAKFERLVPTLETPRFVTGVTAALLTKGELRHTRVRAFISLRSANAFAVETARSFAPLVSLLDLPVATAHAHAALAVHDHDHDDDEVNALYT